MALSASRLRGAHVHRDLDPARNDIGRGVGDADIADGGDDVAHAQGLVAQGEREGRRRQEGVAPSRHRQRAGVAALTVEAHDEAGHARDRGDRRERYARALEHRSLLDVHLDEAAGQRGARASKPREAERRERGAHARAGLVDEIEIRLAEAPADEAAAEHAAPEAVPLLVAEDADRERRAQLLPRKPARGRERREHPERAVEATAPGHRVEVRARPHLGRVRIGSPAPPEEIAGRIPGDLQACLGHPRGDELAGLLLGAPESGTGHTAAGTGADPGQLLEPIHLRSDRKRFQV